MYILVTGGAGYIGSHSCLEIEKSGYTPIIIDNFSRGHKSLVNGRIFYDGDIRDKSILNKIFKDHKISAVLHLAGLAYVKESCEIPHEYFSVNVAGTLSLLESMYASGIHKIVFASSCAVYGNTKVVGGISEQDMKLPISPYGISKHICELAIKSYVELGKLNAVIFRYFNVIGNDDKARAFELHEPETHILPLIIDCALSGKEFILYGADYSTRDGTCERDYVDVRDIAYAHSLGIDVLTTSYSSSLLELNLGGNRRYSVYELISAVEKVTERKVNVRTESRRVGDATSLFANTTRVKNILGWQPTYDLEMSIESRLKFLSFQNNEV